LQRIQLEKDQLLNNKETFSSRSIWWHYVAISVPNQLKRPNSAFVFINGGSNTDR